jgi:hypothetical protein
MNSDFLEALRKLALYFKLETGPKDGGAIDIESLTKVLEAVNSSFQNYFDAELRTQYQQHGKITARVDKEIRALKEEAGLLIVDLKFASFEAAVSPNSITSSGLYSYIEEPLKLKKGIFKSYEQDVFYSNLNDPKTINRLEKKFTGEERSAIFKPLEKTIFHPTRYTFKYGKSFNDLKRSFKPITPEIEKKLIPPAIRPPSSETLYKMYVLTDGEMDLFGPKPKIKKWLASEKMERADYPLQLFKIKSDDAEVILKEAITADVSYDADEKLYYISYGDLNILVWGKDRDEADGAFQFAFISLIQNIYNEEEANLTKKAKEIKKKLAALIDQIKQV